jgi:hypothetical protein
MGLSDMDLQLNMKKFGIEGFSSAAIDATKIFSTRQQPKVQDETKQGVQFPEHEMVKGAIQRHRAMFHEN